jgi:acetylornithine deacetylase/succinyl-diaminopimelate desuccinylase-like protein
MPRIFFLALTMAATAAAQRNYPPEPDRQLAREIFKEFIEIKSGFTTGSTTPVAEAAARRLRAAGFPEADLFVGGAAPHKANLVVRLRGTGARKPILLLAHTDVVEAKREDWTMDPFQFNEKDGYFYGRGTGDDKAQAAVWIANLIRYKREGFRPDRDLIVALTADEEGGGAYNGVQWLLKNKRDLIDADFSLNEGGYGDMVGGKKISNNIEVAEKYVINFRLEVRNKGGHSSMPIADNAIYHLAGALDRIGKFGFPMKVNEVTRAFFGALAKIETGPIKADLSRTAEGDQAAMQRVAAAAPMWNATLRTTCVATQVEAGHAKDALPQLAAANVNCRVHPDEKPEEITATLKRVIANDQVNIVIDGESNQGPPSPMRDDILRAASRVTDTMWPGVPLVPQMVMYATDGKYLRNSGIPTYGIQGFFLDRDNDIRWHGRDERMAVQSFYEGQTFLYELVKALSSKAN